MMERLLVREFPNEGFHLIDDREAPFVPKNPEKSQG
jgi:hypothetical protein